VSGKLSFCTLGSDELSFRKPPSATPVPALAGLPAACCAVPFPLCTPARVQARPGGIMAPQPPALRGRAAAPAFHNPGEDAPNTSERVPYQRLSEIEALLPHLARSHAFRCILGPPAQCSLGSGLIQPTPRPFANFATGPFASPGARGSGKGCQGREKRPVQMGGFAFSGATLPASRSSPLDRRSPPRAWRSPSQPA
jgi:hypothetical protein